MKKYNHLTEINNQKVKPIANNDKYVLISKDKLKELEYYYISIMKIFDNYIKKAGVNPQKDYSIVPSNFINKTNDFTTSLDEVLDSDESRPTLSLGSSGRYVTELQTLLTNLLYFRDSINGVFDTDTQVAVKAFQFNNNLSANGIVARDTWSTLSTLYSPLAICEENIITYTVVSGDTLWSIARRFNTTVDAIKRLNNLTSDVLTVGQRLFIPSSNQSTITYTVVSGDSLWSIARRFNTTVDELKRLNNLTSDVLSIGQKLLIPSSNQSTITYTVVAGDSLWSIARRFNTTVDELKRLNNLTSDVLSIGQKLLIPSSNQSTITYTVVAGDSLWSIARRFNTTVDELKRLNNLTSDRLSIGQQLIIQ